MTPVNITVCTYLKNAHKLKNPSYYARVRIDGKVHDIPLHTKEKSVAESWVHLRRSEVERYNEYVACGETPPSDLLDKLLGVKTTATNKPITPTIGKCMEEWETELRRRGNRERTVTAYCKRIRLSCPLDAPVSSYTIDNVNMWLAKHDHCKSATRKSYSVALREFAKYLIAHHGISSGVIMSWPMVKVQQTERTWWTIPQMNKLIESIEHDDPIVKQSMKTYCWVMGTSGCRQGELYEVLWSDYHDRSITLRAEITKTNRTRTVPLNNGVCELIERLPHDSPRMFAHVPKTQSSRYNMVATAAKTAKVPPGGLHTFRRSACMYLYGRSTDIKATAQLLGNSPAVALQWYTAARQSEQLRETIDKAYEDQILIPNAIDELIKNGLI